MNKLPEWATFVVALVALAQPWFIALWKRYFRRPKIEFHETAKLEIGYSNVGPTLAIVGTFRAIHEDVFVKSFEATVIRNKNKSQYEFTWLAFRSTVLNVGSFAPTHIELPSGFLVKKEKPVTLNIVLNDKITQQEIFEATNSNLKKMLNAEDTYFQSIPGFAEASDSDSLVTPEQKKEFAETYRKDGQNTECYAKVDRCFYWEPGEYTLNLKIMTSEVSTIFEKKLRFVISEEDSKQIKFNVLRITDIHIESYLGKGEPQWRFIYCDYLT